MKIAHAALAKPPWSWRRKLSMNDQIAANSHAAHRKKNEIVQKRPRSG